MEKQIKNKNRNKRVLAFDAVMLTGFLVTGVPQIEGKTLHEWFGVACAALAIAHLLINWDWIAASTRRLLKASNWHNKLSCVLNVALFVDVTVLTFSGLMISEVLLRSLGIEFEGSRAWRSIHSLSADAFLTVVGLHIALHARWIWMTVRRIVGRVSVPRLAAAHIEEVRS